MTNELATWDFTLSAEKNEDEKVLKDNLRIICKKWVFQLEKGEVTGFLHYQGRISLIKKKRLNALINLFKTLPNWKGVHFTPTSNAGTTNFNYVMKLDTRIKGPWTDKDEIIYIPRQVREMGELRPFQKYIVDNYHIWNTRDINIIYCETGNLGKSLLVGYMRAHKLGRALPPVNDYKDLLRMVCDLPTSRCYLFDMPRSLNKDRQYQFFSAIETIKDGYAYDDRYNFKEKVFDCPNIWIFTNTIPETEMLSEDRWKIWTINKKNFELEEYNECMINEE